MQGLTADSCSCKICHAQLQRAQTLPCAHSFCASCLAYYCSSVSGKERLCPVCNQPYQTKLVYDNKALQQVVDAYYKQHVIQLNKQHKLNGLEFSQSYDETPQQVSEAVQYSQQCLSVKQQIHTSDFETLELPKNKSIPSPIQSTSVSLEEVQSQHFDVFHRHVCKCTVCNEYILEVKYNEHTRRCNSQLKSSFGIATMKKITQQSESMKHIQKKTDSLQKKKEIVTRRSSDLIIKQGQVTLSTNIKKIKTDLIQFGFKQIFINQLKSKQQLCDIYNKFIVKYKTYVQNGYDSDIKGLKIMICDDILKDYENQQQELQQKRDIKKALIQQSDSDIPTDYQTDKNNNIKQQIITEEVNKPYLQYARQLVYQQLLERADKSWLLKVRGFWLKKKKTQSQVSID